MDEELIDILEDAIEALEDAAEALSEAGDDSENWDDYVEDIESMINGLSNDIERGRRLRGSVTINQRPSS